MGVCLFLTPSGLYDGGISGTSMLLDRLTPSVFTLSIFLLVLNIPLFAYGLKKQGKEFTIYSLYAVCMYSLFSYIIKGYFLEIWTTHFEVMDLFLCAVFGGILSGIGSGMVIRYGGAIDGVEVMAVIFAKRIGVSVGTFVMCYNCVLYLIAGFIIGSWVLPLYSIVTYMLGLKVVDYIVEGFDKAKCAIIVTNNGDKICKVLSETFESGMTRVSARGGYSSADKTMVYFVVNRFQITKMRDIVHEIDPDAYIIISEVADVFARNIDK
jgi:uncharacterized membrane-anchored protein YitT (DUF2179 family)